ncbi:MAG: helix-turn-helix transcriptional regulator [Candidatus Aminicenantes bacterium]|nr:helix-turn-helix transcriptional regulator [Candidatus Aminicenantes bacterium]
MNRKKVLQDIALRLKKIRETLRFSPVDMTKRIGTYRTNYYKYESATSFPHFAVLTRLGNNLGVSLDWLILAKGPMFYKENRKINAIANAAPTAVLTEVAGNGNTSFADR